MSGGNKTTELQMQMRQNTEDLHNFMKELDSWEEDIKKKDEQLRIGSLEDPQVCNFCFSSLTLVLHLHQKGNLISVTKAYTFWLFLLLLLLLF